MLRRGGDGDVTLGVSIEGLSDAERAVQSLDAMIANLNKGAVDAGVGASAYSKAGASASSNFSTVGAFAGGSRMGSAPMPPGYGAPPAPGVQSPYMAGATMQMPAYNATMPMGAGGVPGGTTTVIQAANVTIMGGATMQGAGSTSPLPGWSPFAGAAGAPGTPPPPGGGGGGTGLGFVEAVYGKLESMPRWQGAAGAHFLSTNPFGRQMLGVGAHLEQFLPQGAMGGAGEMLAGAAPILAGVAAVGSIVGTAAQIGIAGTTARYYQESREIASGQAGRFYDEIALESDRKNARVDDARRGWESFRSSPWGFVARTASFGIADAIWDDWTRKWDREKSVEDARRDRRLSARSLLYNTGFDFTSDAAQSFDWNEKDLPQSLRMIGERAALAESMGPFAPGLASVINGFNFGAYSTPEAGMRTMRTLSSIGMMPGFEGIGMAMNNGADPRQFFGTYRGDAIGRGDVEALFAAREQYNQVYGGVKEGMGALRGDIGRAFQTSSYRTAGQIAGANLAGAEAGISLLAMSGAGYEQLAVANQNLSPLFEAQLSALQAQRAVAVNPAQAAQLDAQIAGLRAQAFDATQRRPAMTMFQGRQTENQTATMEAGLSVRRGMFTSESAAYAGFASQRTALGDQERIYRDMAESRFFSPEERARYAAQADEVRMQIELDLPRERGQFSLGLRQGELGIRSSRADTAMMNASLYGGISDVYGARQGQANIVRQQLSLNGAELAGAFGPRTLQERLELQEKQVSLQRELNQALEEAKRSYASANLSVVQFSQGMTQAHSSYQMQFFGIGGGAAAGLQGEDVAAARQTLSVAKRNFDAVANLPADNPYRQQRERELQDAKIGAQGAVQGIASLPYSVDLDRQQMAGQFSLSAISRTYAAWGDIRGTVTNLMGNVGARGRELQQMRAKGLEEIDGDTSLSEEEKQQRKSVFLRDIESRQYGLANEAIGYQQQLEQGWQDRLISQVVNMPASGAFVASQFTRKEAAPFVQSMSSVFGFSGRGAVGARDEFLHRGARLANSVMGMIQRPDGFMETGMAEAMGGGVLRGGSGAGANGGTVTVKIIVEDTRGNRLGMGETSGTVHDLFNTRGITGSAHAAGVSRQ